MLFHQYILTCAFLSSKLIIKLLDTGMLLLSEHQFILASTFNHISIKRIKIKYITSIITMQMYLINNNEMHERTISIHDSISSPFVLLNRKYFNLKFLCI